MKNHLVSADMAVPFQQRHSKTWSDKEKGERSVLRCFCFKLLLLFFLTCQAFELVLSPHPFFSLFFCHVKIVVWGSLEAVSLLKWGNCCCLIDSLSIWNCHALIIAKSCRCSLMCHSWMCSYQKINILNEPTLETSIAWNSPFALFISWMYSSQPVSGGIPSRGWIPFLLMPNNCLVALGTQCANWQMQ